MKVPRERLLRSNESIVIHDLVQIVNIRMSFHLGKDEGENLSQYF